MCAAWRGGAQLELPNSCIIAALLYIERAVGNDRFSLSLQNWQPCLLAAFVVAAKVREREERREKRGREGG
eukprot:7140332-Prymnesium_polylepis.1